LNDEVFTCLLSHKCSLLTHKLGARLAANLEKDFVRLLIDPFNYGDDFSIAMQAVPFDALLFLLTPEGLHSQACQAELSTARRRAVPIFNALLEGEMPEELKESLSWDLRGLDDETLDQQVPALADAMRSRVFIHKLVQLLIAENPWDVTMEAAQNIFNAGSHTILAEYAALLAKRYLLVHDPNTRYWLALSLGKAGTEEAAQLLGELPAEDHPYALEGIRQALDMIGRVK
jgi:hypothetical protein